MFKAVSVLSFFTIAKSSCRINPDSQISVQSEKPKAKIQSMKAATERSKLAILFLAARPKFLTASAAPVLVGSALGYAVTGSFHPLLFVLAILAILALHAGANITNDYYDHISGNDWLNVNPTPFSGGRLFIQKNILSPKATLLEALFLLTIGAAIGVIIILLTQSVFILILGLAGLLGGFFYTARPIQLGYLVRVNLSSPYSSDCCRFMVPITYRPNPLI